MPNITRRKIAVGRRRESRAHVVEAHRHGPATMMIQIASQSEAPRRTSFSPAVSGLTSLTAIHTRRRPADELEEAGS